MNTSRLFITTAAAVAGIAFAAPLAHDTPLIEDKGIKVTVQDFEAALLRIPEDKRIEIRTSHERIASLVDVTYVARQVAAKARALGLDKDPLVQKRMEQVVDAALTDAYLQHVDKTAKLPALEQRAQELYKTDSAKYRTEEHIYIQHILVGLQGRTRETALQRATELRAGLESSKEDFIAAAKRESDDPDKRRNNGDLGWFSPKSLERPLVEAAMKMKKGEISQPVETRHGYHLVKFIGHKPAEALPFEAVKNAIMASERERLSKDRRDAVLREVRDSTTVVVHKANLEALRVDVDMKATARGPAAAEKAK